MKKLQILNLTVLLTVVSFTSARAETSYLLVQGPFGAGAVVETFKWKIDYSPGAAITGQDLLTAVFGLVTNTTATYQGMPYYSSGSSVTGAGYTTFTGSASSLFLLSLTLHGTTVLQDPSYSPGWNYYVAGGSGDNKGGAYGAGSWSYSDDGIATRKIADGSFDAFVFGSTFPEAPISGTGNTPIASNFTSATPVSAPEPASAFLAAGVLAWRALRRRR